MENKITSTTYVPLQPPYQIIKYSGAIAMQIGTMVVTIQKEGNVNDIGYNIVTHSHPVVIYEDKSKVDMTTQLSAHHFLEGSVWNYVEVKDVTTVCMNGSHLLWKEFIDFLTYDVDHRLCIAQPSTAMYWNLQDLGVEVESPAIEKYVVYLEKRLSPDGRTPVIRSRAGSIILLNAPAVDLEEAWRILDNELRNYMYVIRNRQRPNKSFHITFMTEEEEFRDIVERINSRQEYTYMLYPFSENNG